MRIATIRACVAVASISLVHCLPDDTRPTPGSVLVTVAPSDDVTSGVTTADGWHIVFDKFLIGLGNVTFEDASSCNDYSKLLLVRSGYIRLFNLTVGGPQKLAISYGLGQCSVRFSMRPASSNAVLASGVSAADLALMQQSTSENGFLEGTPAAYLEGHASRGVLTKSFAWTFLAFRRDADGTAILPTLLQTFRDCGANGDTGTTSLVPTSFVNLQGNQALSLPVTVHGEELFRGAWDDNAPFAFDPIANADADGDGTITLTELSQIPAPPLFADAGEGGMPSDAAVDPEDSGVDAGDAGASATFEDFMYASFVQRMIRLAGATCEVADGTRNQ
jgi:hypothetical protein